MYRPEKGKDFKYLDRVINEQFQVGGTDCVVYKYVGPNVAADTTSTNAAEVVDPVTSLITNPLQIQDVIFLENRDRKYDTDAYILRGIYTMMDSTFNLSQFGLFLNNDEILLHFHLRSTVEAIGRKILAGDVIELPHQRDEYADNPGLFAMKKYYVATEVTRPSIGYSSSWYPHLIRVKCQPLVDSQEFKQILDMPAGGNPTGLDVIDGINGIGAGNTTPTLRDIVSTYQTSIDINAAVVAQAEADARASGYDTVGFYVIPTKESGLLDNIEIDGADASDITATADTSQLARDASIILNSPNRDFYIGYLTGDGIPPNGAPYTFGSDFPSGPTVGQFHLRTDYFPNRLFRWNGRHWYKFEDKVRMTMTNTPASGKLTGGEDPYTANRQTQKTGFINNINTSTVNGEVIQERQFPSKVLRRKIKPTPDNT